MKLVKLLMFNRLLFTLRLAGYYYFYLDAPNQVSCFFISGDSALCNYTTVQLFNRKDHVPVLPPNYVTVLNGVFLEIPGLNVTVILRMGVREDERCKVHDL